MPAQPKVKKKPSPKLTQKERFIAAARAAECDESGETFSKVLKKVLVVKKTKN